MLTFDPTITFGAILQAAALVGGLVIAFTRIGGRIDLLAQRVGAVEEAMRKTHDAERRIATTETRQATHGQMIAQMQADLRDLKYGRGFVANRGPEGGLNGEYP